MFISLYPWLKQSGIFTVGALLAIASTACTASANLPSSISPSHVSPSSISQPLKSAYSPAHLLASEQSPTETELLQRNAVRVLQDYYSAIDRQDYRQAYLAWDGEGTASQQSFEQFKQGFENTASTAVSVGEPGELDSAAGSIYIEIPVTISAITQDGTEQEFRGSYVLRKANRVPGSTATQRQWHLYSADITSN
jgi:hypothetical protein